MTHARKAVTLCAVVAATIATGATTADAQLAYTGVNLATAAFQGEYNYPSHAEVDYFVGKGMNVFRLPFLWERLQPTLNGSFNPTEIAQIGAFVDYATSKGATVVLDPHNYARFNDAVVGSAAVPHAAFANLWTRLATTFKGNDRVIFGLMNEPYDMPTEQWVTAANTAIAAIRQTSATNLVLVPGNAYSGAHSWRANYYGTPNATAMLNVVDPLDHYAFDVHQYLDANSSGTTDAVVSPTIGRERITYLTDWLKTHGHKAFLGEFAVPNASIGNAANQTGDEAINAMLDYMEANGDVWLGWSWWAAGQRWNEYMFTMQPTNLGLASETDRASMNLVEPRLVGVPEPAAIMSYGAVAVALGLRRRAQGA